MGDPGTKAVVAHALGWSRRAALLGGVGLAACASCPEDLPAPRPAARSIADAHVHLFNAADLPIVGFMRYVVVREMIGDLAPPAQALIDLFLHVIKPLASTASREAGGASLLGRPPERVTPEAFAAATERRIREVQAAAATTEAGSRLPESYRALSELVSAAALPGTEAGPAGPQPLVPERSRRAFEGLAVQTEAEGTQAFGPRLNRAFPTEAGFDRGAVVRAVSWGYLMTQPRCSHLNRYLKAYRTDAAETRLIINHLIDYDRWLNDGPLPGSDMLAQLALAAKMARQDTGRVELHTFAGFCPLKLAMETRQGMPTTFSRLQAAHARGEISGLKLYPPMGFRPIGNRDLPDEAFVAPDGVRDGVLTRWRAVAGADRLGPALDDALEACFAWCVANDVPVMAHADQGNAPGKGFDQRANPTFWRDLVRRPQFAALRLDLGHFVHQPKPFIDAMAGGDPSGVWALDATKDLVQDRDGRASTVFTDLGYMNALLGDRPLAQAFFEAVARYCDRFDPDYSQIMYGSDWIMLAQEAGESRYLDTLLTGMRDAGLCDAALQNLTWRNARRFMKKGDDGPLACR